MASVTQSILRGAIFLGLMATKAVLADGASIALTGNTRGVPACVTCHGASGAGGVANGFPRLSGLNADYLQGQLNAFATGQRRNAMMTPIAQMLTPDERAALARYYSGLTIPIDPTSTPPNAESTGAKLATKGRWADGLPACVQCHGATGAGVGSIFPALAGQSALYIENQLHAWQQGSRAPGPMGLMKLIASKLSKAEIKSVAAYFATLTPDATEKGRTP